MADEDQARTLLIRAEENQLNNNLLWGTTVLPKVLAIPRRWHTLSSPLMPRSKSQFRKGKTPKKPTSAIRRDLDTLIQGVSQQPPHLRLAGQGTKQVNGWSSPVEGPTKRNAMRLQSKILDNPCRISIWK